MSLICCFWNQFWFLLKYSLKDYWNCSVVLLCFQKPIVRFVDQPNYDGFDKIIWPPSDCNQYPVHSTFESSNLSWRLVILPALIYQQSSSFWVDINLSSFLLCECCEILTWGRLYLILCVHLLGFGLHPKVP